MQSDIRPARGFWGSTVGLKWIMALTGVLLVGFVFFHMASHLQVLAGPEAYNDYAAFMYGLGLPLWVARLGLLTALGLHIWAAVSLNRRNRRARPHRYRSLRHQVTSIYALTMMVSGVIVLAFVVYHLLHFTFGVVHDDYFHATDAAGRRDVYTNFVKSFEQPLIVVLYVVGNVFVASHLAHAVSSMLRTVGLSRGTYRTVFDRFSLGFALIVVVGYLSMPLAVLLGFVTT